MSVYIRSQLDLCINNSAQSSTLSQSSSSQQSVLCTGTCSVCHRSNIHLTRTGLIYYHGSRSSPCTGNGLPPLGADSNCTLSNVSTLTEQFETLSQCHSSPLVSQSKVLPVFIVHYFPSRQMDS